MSRVYLAGPMRGIPEFNFPTFFRAGDELSEMGHEVHNPADEDHSSGFMWEGTAGNEDIRELWPADKPARSINDVLGEDIAWILENADAVAVLPGWEKSKGARAEVSAALAVGIPVAPVSAFGGGGIVAPDSTLIHSVPDDRDGYRTVYLGNEPIYEEFIRQPLLPPLDKEVRVTSETGGQKGAKRARFDLIPTGALHQLAEHYGKGAEKYEPVNGKDNWRNGYAWSLSYAAMQRHANAFWSGEDVDPETGSPHLVAVAWHAFSLLTFMADPNLREKFDDRQDNR